MVLSSATRSVARQDLLGKAQTTTVRQHAQIKGAKNILLVGVDARPGQDPNLLVRSDSIMIMHISADHGTAYLISLPRDSYVPGVGSVELLNGASMQLLRSVKADDVAAFLKTHPTWRAG